MTYLWFQTFVNCLLSTQTYITLQHPEFFVACAFPSIHMICNSPVSWWTVAFTRVMGCPLKTTVESTFIALSYVSAFWSPYVESISMRYVSLVDFTNYDNITAYKLNMPNPTQNKSPTSYPEFPLHFCYSSEILQLLIDECYLVQVNLVHDDGLHAPTPSHCNLLKVNRFTFSPYHCPAERRYHENWDYTKILSNRVWFLDISLQSAF